MVEVFVSADHLAMLILQILTVWVIAACALAYVLSRVFAMTAEDDRARVGDAAAPPASPASLSDQDGEVSTAATANPALDPMAPELVAAEAGGSAAHRPSTTSLPRAREATDPAPLSAPR